MDDYTIEKKFFTKDRNRLTYKIDELYIATIVPIKYNKEREIIKPNLRERFYLVVHNDQPVNMYWDPLTIDMYECFNDLDFKQIIKNQDKNYIIHLKPLIEKYRLTTKDATLKLEEIQDLNNELNRKRKKRTAKYEVKPDLEEETYKTENEQEKENTTVKDVFLKEVIKTMQEIDNNINSNKRSYLIDELTKLAMDYINSVVQLTKEKKQELNQADKFLIQQIYVKKLVELEWKIKECKEETKNVSNLLQEMEIVNSYANKIKRK